MRPQSADDHQLPPAAQTAVIVPVPAAEPVVGRHRAALDVAATWGVPAHVTVLYPFVHPGQVDTDVLTKVGAVVGSTAPFDCTFAGTRWFGEDVLWLDPTPAQPFAALTRAMWDAFPDTPPYGGAYGDAVIPHLTVGERRHGTVKRLRAAERDVQAALPVTTRIESAWLIAGSEIEDSWRLVRAFPLGATTV